MATDFFAMLTEDLARPIRDRLSQLDIDAEVSLAPPTRAGSGDLSFACHSLARFFRKAPQVIAEELATCFDSEPRVTQVETVSGFLNLYLDWTHVAPQILEWSRTDDGALGLSQTLKGRRILVEYSSPNTNKPLHLGHCRNIILGSTVARILKAAGGDVVRVNLVNDRGIHICKSMVAYQNFGHGATPDSSGLKSDHFIGHYYVLFDKAMNEEYLAYSQGLAEPMNKDDYFNSELSSLGSQTRKMLVDWEAGIPDVRELWSTMNAWCEAGFEETYQRMGVGFERVYHESQTYLLGKDLVAEGLDGGIFKYAANGAVVFDLETIGLNGEKAVLRADGTSVYVTQDIGTAVKRFEEYEFDQMVYVTGNEQDHHFRVLFGILESLKPNYAGKLKHLSYGMVELPDGKMKSREGTVVDADDLMDELQKAAADAGRSRWPHLTEEQLFTRAEAIAQGGLKYFLLKYAPVTTFVFDRERSISLEGETGAYCQYAYARATSMLRKLDNADVGVEPDYGVLSHEQAQAVLKAMLAFPTDVRTAALELKPSVLTKSTFELAKSFAAFYNHKECRVIGAEPAAMAARAQLVRCARRMLGAGLELLGMVALEEM